MDETEAAKRLDLALGDGHGNDDRPGVGFGPDLVAVPMSPEGEALVKAKFFLGRTLGALENEGEVSHALWLEADNFLREELRG